MSVLCWTKSDSIKKRFFKPQSLFSATIQNAVEKFHRRFVEQTTVALTSGLACKNTSSLQHSVILSRSRPFSRCLFANSLPEGKVKSLIVNAVRENQKLTAFRTGHLLSSGTMEYVTVKLKVWISSVCEYEVRPNEPHMCVRRAADVAGEPLVRVCAPPCVASFSQQKQRHAAAVCCWSKPTAFSVLSRPSKQVLHHRRRRHYHHHRHRYHSVK